MQIKPRILVDAVILIDVWGANSWSKLNEETGGSKFTNEDWVNYQKAYIKGAHKFLQNINFNVLINATYRNGKMTSFNHKKALKGLDQNAAFTPMHYKRYNCEPFKKFFSDCTMADIRKLVKPRGKIIVGGGSWGACVHYRPVGMTRLMKEGFKVFTAPELCYQEPHNKFTHQEQTGINHQDLLVDDIVWSRSSIDNHYYDNLYEGLMIHPDDALDRVDPYGVSHRDKPG